jgi:ABC-type anion transport system duplicated permease subunit
MRQERRYQYIGIIIIAIIAAYLVYKTIRQREVVVPSKDVKRIIKQISEEEKKKEEPKKELEPKEEISVEKVGLFKLLNETPAQTYARKHPNQK